MACRLCGEDRPLIEAHIIPRPFFRDFGVAPGHGKVLSSTAGVYPKKVRTGFYDPGILCGSCDNKIGVWDQYGSALFLDQLDQFVPFPDRSNPVAFARSDYDFVRLRLFLLSVLWRAGISSLAMFDRVRLGPYEMILHRLISEADPGPPDDFCTVLSIFTTDGEFIDGGVPLADPFRERWQGVNAYRISFGLITAYIKVDKRPFLPSFEQMALRSGRPLFLIERDFQTSSEANVARNIVQKTHNRRAFRKSRPDA
jgi:hypothetical protein